jgi:type IV fimbrial biogenesis protein FimT
MAQRAFTLPELLLVLAIIAVTLLLGLPSFGNLVAAERATSALNGIVGGVAVARTQAILQRRTVTLCPGRAGGCLGRDQWHQGALIFIDEDGDGVLDVGERLVATLPALRGGGRIYWRSFRNRSYLQFHPRGYTQWQNGNLLYCPPDGRARHARMAILNAQGRVRMARDADRDGIVEDASGNPVRCP